MKFCTATISDIALQIKTGKTPPTGISEYFNGDVNWYTPSDLSKETYLRKSSRTITDKAINEKKAVVFDKDTVLISCIGDIGKLGITSDQSSSNQQITGIKLNDRVNPLFFYYWCKRNKKLLETKSRQAIVAILNNEEISKIKISYPENYADQIQIANLLTRAENLIAKRKESIKALDDLLKSTFLEMFGDPVKNEKGWVAKTAIDFADCIVPGRDKPKSFTGTTPWVTTDDLIHLGFTRKSKSNIGLTGEEIKEVRARVIPKESVIITCVGDLGVATIAEVDMVVNQQLHAFQCQKKINNIFFMHAIAYHKLFMYKRATKTTLPYMNKTVCNSIPMINPPLNLQSQFANLVLKTELIKVKYLKSLSEMEKLYETSSQKAFSVAQENL